MPQIVLEHVRKEYRIGGNTIHAVGDVSLTIEKGDFISVVGHSGSGKTTLLSIVGGLLSPTSGRVFYEGTDIYALDSDRLSEYRNRSVGFMFQFASLLPMLTAKENVLLPLLFSDKGDGRAGEKAREYLDVVGLGDRTDAYPSQLSGGQQRRVAIARAFMNEPGIILADEPTGDLDEETEAEIMALFRKMNRERQFTFVFITHNLDLAKQAPKRLRMTRGELSGDQT